MAKDKTPTQDVLAAARKLQEGKLLAVGRVVETRANIARIERELAEAQKEDGVAYAEAAKAGWSESELRSIGIPAPAVRVPGRPRSNGRRRPTPVEVERSGAQGLVADQVRREAEASTRLDGETQSFAEPAQESAGV